MGSRRKAQETLVCMASCSFDYKHNIHKTRAVADINGRLNLTLTRSIARAILFWLEDKTLTSLTCCSLDVVSLCIHVVKLC